MFDIVDIFFVDKMKFKIVAVGKLKESYWREAVAEYVKRIGRFATVEITEIEECAVFNKANGGDVARSIETEGERILQKLEGYVVAMDIDGQLWSSERISAHIASQKQLNSTFTFVIGGSNGLSDAVKNRADLRLSFGKITLPHQLFRVVLLEQLYRVCCIENNIAYHK